MNRRIIKLSLLSLLSLSAMKLQASELPEWTKQYTEKARWDFQCTSQGYKDVQEVRKCREAVNLKECLTFTDDGFNKKFYPVDEKMLVMKNLRYLGDSTRNYESMPGKFYDDLPPYQECKRSKVWLSCTSGSCLASLSGGEYGFSPGERSTASIDGMKWSWVGDDYDAVGRQMWTKIKNGSRVAYQLSHWPDSYPSGVENVIIPEGMKERMYQLSLTREN